MFGITMEPGRVWVNHRYLLAALLAVVAIAGVIVWVVMGPANPGKRGAPPSTIADDSSRALDGTALDANADSTSTSGVADDGSSPDAAGPLEIRDTDSGDISSRPGGTSSQGSGAQGASPTGASPPGSSPSGASQGATPATAPAQPRRLSAAEREEVRRNETGRPALAERLARTPTTSASARGLSRSIKPDEWAESFYNDGITPPEMIPTPVAGKIMSEQSREGLAEATLALVSFFPINDVAGGPLLPVVTELVTDAQGNFSGEIPGPKVKPFNYPSVAIVISWQGHRIIAGNPLQPFESGKLNHVGILWAPEVPYELECDATQFSGSMTVVSTGQLNPQRWHESSRAKTLAYFGSFAVTPDDIDTTKLKEGQPAPGKARLISSWNGSDLPHVSLLREGAFVQVRRPARASVVSNKGSEVLPQPFEPLVFDNTSWTPISGQVIDVDGAPVGGAILSTIGGEVLQTAVTDAGGWFSFDEPPEKTSDLKVVHADWVETVVTDVKPGDTGIQAKLVMRRPRFLLHVRDLFTQMPITEISLEVTGNHPHGKNAGKAMKPEHLHLTSTNGEYFVEWPVAIRQITLEKLGYFPRTIKDPMKLWNQSGEPLLAELSPGRKLDIRPRDYTSVQDTSRWFPDTKPEDPGIYTAWAGHWIEYEVDFGSAPEPGQEGGFFDIVLGCTNRGIVDNNYKFTVDVFVGEEKKGTLSILADSVTVREGRMALGKLSGVQKVRLVWTNDKWIPDQLDANIRYATLKFLEQPK